MVEGAEVAASREQEASCGSCMAEGLEVKASVRMVEGEEDQGESGGRRLKRRENRSHRVIFNWKRK